MAPAGGTGRGGRNGRTGPPGRPFVGRVLRLGRPGHPGRPGRAGRSVRPGPLARPRDPGLATGPDRNRGKSRRPGLGRPFTTLWAANSVSTLGDGVVETAAPLLVASVSDDPVLVGFAALVGQLPWLLFSLVSGAVVDRLDKRRLIVAVDVLRGAVTALLAAAVATGHATIPVIYGCAFLLGTAETLAQNAASSLVPAVVPSALLPQANARLHGSFFVLNRFAGRPLGAWLFVLAAALPFGLNAVSFLVSAALIATMRGLRPATPAESPAAQPAHPPAAHPADPPAAQSAHGQAESPADPPAARPADSSAAHAVHPPGVHPADPPAAQAANPSAARPADSPAAHPAHPPAARSAEPPAVHPADPPAAQPAPRQAGRPADESGQHEHAPSLQPAGQARAETGGGGRSVGRDIADGLRWVWHEPVIRMMSLTLCLMNATLLAGFSIMVLYARDRLGLGAVGYGVLMASSAVGGIAGVLAAPALQSRCSASLLLRAGLVVETLTHLGLALAGTPWAAGAVLVVFGVHSSVLGSVETTYRQRRVPEELRGRVQSVFFMFAIGGNVVGALIGGPLARWQGVTAPFWCSAVAMAVVTAVAWRPFGRNLDRLPSRSRPVAAQSPGQP